MSDPAASNWIDTVKTSPEFVSMVVSVIIGLIFTFINRFLDKNSYSKNLSADRDYQKKLFYYQTTVLKIYDALATTSHTYKAILNDCVDLIQSTSNITASKKKKIVEDAIDKLDKINTEFEIDIIPKARILSEEYSQKLEEYWVSYYDDVVKLVSTLNVGNFPAKSKAAYTSVATRQAKFLSDLVTFTKAQHPKFE